MKMEQPLTRPSTVLPVAVVGMHGRFPGAKDIRQYWENLCEGHDPITEVPKARWDADAILGEPDGAEERTYATTGGFSPHVDCFDCKFFNILPREAQSMDPQQRLFLQTSLGALEDAGIAPRDLAGRSVGVFVGVGHADYPVLMRRDHAPFDVFRGTGIVPTAIANRVSFTLDLRGPSEAIDTACSGSLVAIHRACQALAFGECDLAIAGGVNLLLGPELFIAFAKAGMLSRKGRCRPFDASGDGYVRGEGVATVVLKQLHAAEADGDFIYGVVRGSAEGHGGKAHSFTAPSVAAQADVITRAWARSGRTMWDACLIETHGTGTRLGDPIEIKALTKAFDGVRGGREGTAEKRVALGAVKSQVGHLEAAAGIAGVIKALLAMQHRVIPQNLHFERLNPEIDLTQTPFYLPELTATLPERTRAPLAGVSSFGFGGSNAHVVLEGHSREPSRKDAGALEQGQRAFLIPLSARTEAALIGRVWQLIDYLADGADISPTGTGKLLGTVSEAFGLGALANDGGQIALAALNISVEQLLMALRCIGERTGRRLALGDVRDCLTLGDIAAVLETSATSADRANAQNSLLLTRTAIPATLRRRTTLAEIGFSLMHGRDAMEERLAIVAENKRDLLAKLETFVSSPQDQISGCLRGSTRLRRGGDDRTEPAAPAGLPSARELEEWGRYWVSSVHAKLEWKALHHAARPRKIPLPSYPFELTRIWYTAGKADAEPALVPKPAEMQEAVRDLGGQCPIAEASPRIAVSSSFEGLGALLEQLEANGAAHPIALNRLDFGRPIDIRKDAFECRLSSETGAIIQCLYVGDAKPCVLVQGRFGPATQEISAEGGNVGDGDLLPKTSRLWSEPHDRSFWASLFATLVAGSVNAPRDDGKRDGSPVPYRLASLVLDPAVCRGPIEIRIARSTAGNGIDAIALGDNGRPALVLRGLELRQDASATETAKCTAVDRSNLETVQ